MKTKQRDPREKFVKYIYKIMQNEVYDIHDSLTDQDGLDSPATIHDYLLNRTLEEREKVALASAGGVLRASLKSLEYFKLPMSIRSKGFEKTMESYKLSFEELSER